MEFQQATRCLTCNLENMQIKKIKRSKKNAESVTEEKFALLFKSKFQMADMQFNVRELSLKLFPFRFLYILFGISLIFSLFLQILVCYLRCGFYLCRLLSSFTAIRSHNRGQPSHGIMRFLTSIAFHFLSLNKFHGPNWLKLLI